jgi:hypothetical protein
VSTYGDVRCSRHPGFLGTGRVVSNLRRDGFISYILEEAAYEKP